MAQPPERPAFRPDLEGLRGIAILLVVLFHAGVPALAGGFVGVDVFFVLSGFFITGMLARELSANGSVDINAFYTRRAVRLMPALLVTLLVTLGIVFWFYAPIDRGAIADEARAVAMHAGNVSLARGGVDYFQAGENPLLHTWSLAVEEQFYLVWPLFFLALSVLGFARNDDGRESNRLLVALAAVGALSFVASLWLTSVAQPWAFYGMPTRIWEFALGGSLALLAGQQQVRASMAMVLQGAGLAMILFAAVSFSRATAYPGVAAIFPALGTCLILLGGESAPGGVVGRVLGARWLAWLGRVSYAWYLWHWPLVGLGAVLDPGIGVSGKLAWSAGALILAWLTWRFVEGPVRNGSSTLDRVPSHLVLPATLAGSVVVAVMAHGAMVAADRYVATSAHRQFALARVDRKDHGCWANTLEDATGPCEFGDVNASRTVVLFGDSHAEHWLGALDQYGREHGVKVVAMVKGGCPVAEMPELLQPRLGRYYHECSRYREAMVRRIIAMRPSAAILSSWDHYMPTNDESSEWHVTPEAWREGLRRTYGRIANAGIPVVALRGTPRTWFDVPSCLSRWTAHLPGAQECVYERARSLSPVAADAQTEAARGLRVRFVDMNDQICPTARCPVMRDGIVVFTDDNHLTATFSRSLATVFGERIERAVESANGR